MKKKILKQRASAVQRYLAGEDESQSTPANWGSFLDEQCRWWFKI